MKNQILALSFGLMTIGAFAQKAELKVAEKAIKNSEFAAALTAVNSLDAMEASMEAKYKAKYYYLKGQALSGQDSYSESADAFNKLFSYEIEIGKAKYTKLAQPMLNSMIEKISNKAAKLYNDDKDYKGASENFYLTYRLYPLDTTTLYNAAISASLAKEYDLALDFYNELKTIGYTGVLTQYLAVNKETNETENLGGKGQRDLMVKAGGYINPTDETTESKQIEIIKNIGYILVSQGKTEEAIIAIKEARKSNPKDLNLLLNEADLYVKLEQMDKFGDLMEEAITLDPTNPTLFFNLGVVNQNQKKTDEALRYYKKAIELKPDYADAYMNLSAAILSGQLAIVEEMNKNLSNFKKYDELEAKQKDLYKKALPFLEKADGIKRTLETVRSLLNIYDILEMTDKADALRPIYKEMRG
ncbi:MAG: tetratricopeptide (TPR) repeat protein [Pseudohongiellaceae bacterium]|jgi:tetratricopeptide (TPR) repeat protein